MTEQERRVRKDVNRQIGYIALHGCTNIRCNDCYMKGVCPHIPTVSSTVALQIIEASRRKERGDK